MVQFIQDDVVWKSGSKHILDEDIAIAAGASLTIMPGAVVIGNDFTIQSGGLLRVAGEEGKAPVYLNEVNFDFQPNANGQISIEHSHIDGGSFSTSYGDTGLLKIASSLLDDVDPTYLVYTDWGSEFRENIVTGNTEITFLGHYEFNIRDNLFYSDETHWADKGRSATSIQIWSSTPTMEGNTFLSSGKEMVRLMYEGSELDATDNYWGTTVGSKIQGALYDRNDDLYFSEFIDVSTWLTEETSKTPKEIWSWTTVSLPAEVAINVKLFGREKIDAFGNSSGNELIGNSGSNALVGYGGKDSIFGKSGNDILEGGGHNDLIEGGNGRDNLFGGNGRDVLDGGRGKDIIAGGKGSDTLTGGAGRDVFEFNLRSGVDDILDFDDGRDKIHLEGRKASFKNVAILEDGVDTIIKWGRVEITLDNVQASDITINDFIF